MTKFKSNNKNDEEFFNDKTYWRRTQRKKTNIADLKKEMAEAIDKIKKQRTKLK